MWDSEYICVCIYTHRHTCAHTLNFYLSSPYWVVFKKIAMCQHYGKGRKNLPDFPPYIIQISDVLILPNAMATSISVFQLMKGILGIIGSCLLEHFCLTAIEILDVSSWFCVCASIQDENKSS